MAQLEERERVEVEGGEERVYLVKTVAAESWEAPSIAEVLSAHFQGAGRKDRERSCIGVFVPRYRCLDPSGVSFQALSVIKPVVLGQGAPCLLFVMQTSGIGSDW
jgi:hypothetical protein